MIYSIRIIKDGCGVNKKKEVKKNIIVCGNKMNFYNNQRIN